MSSKFYPYYSVALLCAMVCVPVTAKPAEVIVVTASRIPQALHTLGSAVTVIDLDEWPGPKLMIADVLRYATGIHLVQSGGVGQIAELRMRGGESNHTLVLLDGVELNNPTTGALDFAHLTTAGIQRIEILRGAQSALWGSHAISGVINLISRKEGAATLRMQSGSDGERMFSAQMSHQAKHVRINTSLQNFQTHGNVTAPQGTEEDGYRNRTAQVGLHWTPTPDTTARLLARHTQAHAEYDSFDFPARMARDAPYQAQTRNTLLNAGLDTRLWGWHQQWDVEYLQSNSRTEDGFPSNTTTGRTRAKGLLWKKFGADETPVTLGGGVEWERERYSRDTIGPLTFHSASLLGILKWQALESLHTDLSVRHDDNRDFQDATTWRASAAWSLPSQPLRFYLASGVAITDPTLTERFGFFPATFAGNPDLKPEHSRSHEVGVAFEPAGICCDLELRYFRQRLRNEIATLFDPVTFVATPVNRQGRSHRRGIEFEFRAQPTPQWAVSGGYTWLRATQGSAGQSSVESRRPRHQYQLALQYLGHEWEASLDASTVRGLVDFGQTLDNHRRVRLSLRYPLTPQLDAVLKIDNLLDESYQEVLGYAAADRSIRVGLIWKL